MTSTTEVPAAADVEQLIQAIYGDAIALQSRLKVLRFERPELADSLSYQTAFALFHALPLATSSIQLAVRELTEVTNFPSTLHYQLEYLQTLIAGAKDQTFASAADELTMICSVLDRTFEYIENVYDQHAHIRLTQQGYEEIRRARREILSIASQLDIERSKSRAETAAVEAESAAEASKQAAGTSANFTLGDFYANIASDEGVNARRFRLVAIGCFLLAVAVAIYISYAIINDHQESLQAQLFKLATSIPILAVAFYMSHEANSHRLVARRAKEVEVRLKTMEAYLAPLDSEQKALLRAKVGESILTGPLALSKDAEKQVVQAQPIIDKLIDKLGT